jgi:CopG family nickel-responsive transcriptional regulator
MAQAVRFSVSLDRRLLKRFDRWLKARKYTNRSEAVRDLIREQLVEEDLEAGTENAAAAAVIVYDHDELDLSRRLADLQHDHYGLIISTSHVHTDPHNCLEVILLRGPAARIKALGRQIISTRGVKFGRLNLATTGAHLP